MLLVTGASGFLGSAVVARARQRGLDVRAMVRRSSDLSLLGDLPDDAVAYADMTDAQALADALRGCDAVIHCAATTSSAAPDLELSRRVNVEGTRLLLEACAAQGVRRFVNISSQSAHDRNTSVYGMTKLEQDEAVRAAADIEWTILKPSIIYGPQARGIFDKMVAHCRKLPAIPVIGSGLEPMRPIHVDDVADAALDCLEHGETIGRVYDLGGADELEFNDFLREILRALGLRKRLVHLPIPVAMALARALSLVMKNPPLTPDNVRGIQFAPSVDISAAARDFGFAPRSFRRGLRESFAQPEPQASSTDSPPLRVAIVGLGKMGVMHAAMCQAVPGARVAALMDLDPGLGSQVRSMGVDAPFYESLDDLLRGAEDLDAAIVATPQFTHRQIATACLESGLHVLCEKPLAHTIDDARAMAQAAAERPDLVCAVGFMKGHYPHWLEAARRLSEGWLGAPRRFRATVYLSQVLGPRKGWTFTKDKAGGGILINSGIHLVHFLTVLFGDVQRVVARSRPMHSAVEDTLAALIEFRSGVFGSYDTSWSVPGYQTEGTTVVVECDDGMLEITDDCLRSFHLHGSERLEKGWTREHRAEFDRAAFNLSPDYGGEGYYNQVEDFVRAIRAGGRPRYDWQTGLAVQRVVDALYRSCESGEPETLR